MSYTSKLIDQHGDCIFLTTSKMLQIFDEILYGADDTDPNAKKCWEVSDSTEWYEKTANTMETPETDYEVLPHSVPDPEPDLNDTISLRVLRGALLMDAKVLEINEKKSEEMAFLLNTRSDCDNEQAENYFKFLHDAADYKARKESILHTALNLGVISRKNYLRFKNESIYLNN